MFDGDGAVRGGQGSGGEGQVGEVRADGGFAVAGFERDDAEDFAGEPGGGPGGPAVAKGVTLAFVAAFAAVAVDVAFVGRDDLVHPAGVFEPFGFEGFEEGGGAEVEHAAPVGSDQVEASGVVVGEGAGLEDVVAEPGGELAVGLEGEADLVGVSRVFETGDRADGVDVFARAFGERGGAEFLVEL